MQRPPPSGLYQRLVKVVLVAAVTTSFVLIGGLLVEVTSPRFAPLVVVGLVGGAVLVFVYRDHLIRPY